MKQTFLDIVYKTFYDTSQKHEREVKLLLSRKFYYPSIQYSPELIVKIPLPRKIDDFLIYSGYRFSNSPEQHKQMWGFFLGTIYHLAAHVAVTNFSLYREWVRNKTMEICWKVIDLIEDNAVNRYLSTINLDAYENIENMKKLLIKKPTYLFSLDVKKLEKINEEMENEVLLCFDNDHKQKLLEWADILYKSRNLLLEETPTFFDQHDKKQIIPKNVNFDIKFSNEFNTTIEKLSTIHNEEQEKLVKYYRRVRKQLKNSSFTKVNIPDEDIQEYFKLKEENKRLIKKIRDQIRQVVNNSEDPYSNFYGEIDMEKAIQAISSNTADYAEVFDKNEDQRIEESWGILIDNSASLRLRFKPVKDFMLCLSEASDELTGPGGSWGLFSFDQKFSVLKDFREAYNQDVKSRIGGLRSGGLSFTPDSIVLSGRVLTNNPADIKHLFVFTDDFPTGKWGFDQRFHAAVKEVEHMGIDVIGIGLSPNIQKYFRDYAWGYDMRDLLSKFIKIYRMKSMINI